MADTNQRVRGRSVRRQDLRDARQRFLIVCEGKQTEPNYFRAFRTPGLVVTARPSPARGVPLIDEAQRLRQEADDDQVWCVFDRDDLSAEQISAAFQRADRQGIRIAFSNQAFELWLLLHFDYLHTALPRSAYAERLSQRLSRPYDKADNGLYELLLKHQTTAIANARRLFAAYAPWRPAQDDPSTTVHVLVEELNRHRLR